MKKIQLRFTILGLVLLCFSCSKETVNEKEVQNLNENSIEEQIVDYFNTPFQETKEVSAYADAMKQVLILAKDAEFRRIVFEQALLQKSGDYDLTIESLAVAVKGKEKFKKDVVNLKAISEKISRQTNLKPIIFFPRAETLERKSKNTKSSTSSKELKEPIAVFKNVYDENYDSPGYVLDENNNLVFSKMVSEEYAWKNDVYVIGNAEANYVLPDPDDPWGGGGGTPPPLPQYDHRTEGRAEYGGKIQITDVNAIKHWTAGKLEMRVIVVNESGTVVKDRQYPKRARSNFKDNDWYDFNDFFFNWNTPNIGDFTIENWIEHDAEGEWGSITISVPTSSEDGNPTINVTVPIKSKDENLGKSIVQFSDGIGLKYSISHLNFQRQ